MSFQIFSSPQKNAGLENTHIFLETPDFLYFCISSGFSCNFYILLLEMPCLSVGPSIRPYPTIFTPSNAHAHHAHAHHIIAWVTRPERPKGAKDKVKPAQRTT